MIRLRTDTHPKSRSDRALHGQLEAFALAEGVRTTRDSCGEAIIGGKHGHIYSDDTRFGIVLLDNAPTQPSKARALIWRRKKALAGGFLPHQMAESESILFFDARDPQQARLALHLIGARRRRRLSTEHRERLAIAGKPTQFRKRDGSTVFSRLAGTRNKAETTGSVGGVPLHAPPSAEAEKRAGRTTPNCSGGTR
jgi:hypothetical protein